MKKTALAVVGLSISLVALAAEPLHVKTGQWEITFTTETHGMPPIPEKELEKMGPEQRAKLLAMFASRNDTESEEHKSLECVTQEDLEKPFHPSKDDACETTVLKSTASAQDIAVSCKGEHPSTGKMHVEASSPESMKGNIDIALAGGKEAMQIKTRMSGRWVGPTCKKDD